MTIKEEPGEVARLLSYVVLLAVSFGLFLEAHTIPTSRFEILGAGAFPMLVHGTLITLLVIAIAGSVRRIPGDAYGRVSAQIMDWIRARRLVFAVFSFLAIYLWFMPVVGYPIATFAFLAVLQITLAPKTRKSAAIAITLALIFSFGLNWLFAEVFNVFLPRGL
ncbi:hypothetical protein P775_16025 [Puniceibacterium antarcticum]|uniref:DUF1468 domain-containing protein n=2 Tax=Puniceibacterium antarcticum TaxID=1206336 RepID=A0A2G8RC75_9RHOB|nr:hypothetical protein P775_16025 [Puniceibacterium antarcticum]